MVLMVSVFFSLPPPPKNIDLLTCSITEKRECFELSRTSSFPVLRFIRDIKV